MRMRCLALTLVCLTLPACGAGDAPPEDTGGGRKMGLIVKSSAFAEGGVIPSKYTVDGANVSPPLTWSGAPEGTKSFALLVDDPDAPSGDWVHWVYFNIPADRAELPEAVPAVASPPTGGTQGINSFRKTGYGGPSPPRGFHRYVFRVYALDATLDLDAKATKTGLLKAVKGRVLAEGKLMGKYQRKR